mmetsp:Transcript_23097/g.57432  ORF Transcript_23097/g.57432 Transcript_23097/m.57432 type:complete len:265 (+) Transcript_23097:470-1264(+)
MSDHSGLHEGPGHDLRRARLRVVGDRALVLARPADVASDKLRIGELGVCADHAIATRVRGLPEQQTRGARLVQRPVARGEIFECHGRGASSGAPVEAGAARGRQGRDHRALAGARGEQGDARAARERLAGAGCCRQGRAAAVRQASGQALRAQDHDNSHRAGLRRCLGAHELRVARAPADAAAQAGAARLPESPAAARGQRLAREEAGGQLPGRLPHARLAGARDRAPHAGAGALPGVERRVVGGGAAGAGDGDEGRSRHQRLP